MISRRGGIWLTIFFAAVKVAMMVMMIILGILAVAGVFHQPTYASENLAPSKAFKDAASDPYGYADAFLFILWAYSGFDQPNYVRNALYCPQYLLIIVFRSLLRLEIHARYFLGRLV
jgi:amino acid transporter